MGPTLWQRSKERQKKKKKKKRRKKKAHDFVNGMKAVAINM